MDVLHYLLLKFTFFLQGHATVHLRKSGGVLMTRKFLRVLQLSNIEGIEGATLVA
jgi:hypothetical protein